MNLLAIISNFRIEDGLDILFLTVLAYHLFIWFQGTKAFKVLVGLLVLGAVFTVAKTWGLFLTTWVFQFLWQILVILIVVLFQSEIRQVLEKVNPLQRLRLKRFSEPGEWASEFVKGIFALAKEKTGVLVIIERADKVKEYMTEGQGLEANPTPEILKSIFQKDSPLHDGAILLKEGQITEVACYLPLSPAEGLPKEWGTRHRAALGLSERCNAWVVVVSEERGRGFYRQRRPDRFGGDAPAPSPDNGGGPCPREFHTQGLERKDAVPSGPPMEDQTHHLRCGGASLADPGRATEF